MQRQTILNLVGDGGSINFYFVKRFSIIIIFCFLFSSCEKDHLCDCFKSTGKIIEQRRFVDSWKYIDVRNVVNVKIIPSQERKIIVRTGEHIIEGITTETENNVLTISNENKCNWIRNYDEPLEVYVYADSIERITHYGQGDISCELPLHAESLELNTWSSGNVSLNIDAHQVQSTQHVSVADMTLRGTAYEVFLYTNALSPTDHSQLVSQITHVDSRASGSSYVNPQQLLTYSIKASGSIYYSGMPILDGEITGTGQLIQR